MKPKKDKYFFGAVKVGEKGQIVIPKHAREVFGIEAGDQLLVFGDAKQGIAIAKAEMIPGIAKLLAMGTELAEEDVDQ